MKKEILILLPNKAVSLFTALLKCNKVGRKRGKTVIANMNVGSVVFCKKIQEEQI